MNIQFSNLIILVILVVSVLGSNKAVALAAAIVLIINLIGLDGLFFPFLEARGLELGLILLTASLLVPLASGQIDSRQVVASFTNVRSILAVAIGILVAFLGGRGLTLMVAEPQIVTAIIFGTIIGVAVFQGVPVGPIICSGMLYFLFKLFRL
jgi:uncharacterized membrane protein (DUF441 family)